MCETLKERDERAQERDLKCSTGTKWNILIYNLSQTD